MMFSREERKLSSLAVSNLPKLGIGEAKRSRFRNADRLVKCSDQ